MRLIIQFALVIILFSGCAGWKANVSRTLDHIHEAGVVAREVGVPAIGDRCKKVAVGCRELGDKECVELHACHDKLDKFKVALKSVQFLFIDGKLALSTESEDSANGIVSKALKLLAEINSQLRELGVLK